MANKTQNQKNQRIRCQIFWLTYQNNKKKPKEKTPNRDCKSKKLPKAKTNAEQIDQNSRYSHPPKNIQQRLAKPIFTTILKIEIKN